MSIKAQAFQQACRARLTPPTAVCTRPNTRYASQTSTSSSSSSNPTFPSSASARRRAITVTSDDGRYHWSELSTGEKAARGTQQTFNAALVAAGVGGTCLVSYFLYQELFAADSKTVQFNHAVDRVKASQECRDLLGPSRKIVAFGEPTSSKWARARPLAYTTNVDRTGTMHFRMHFNVEGEKAGGVVVVHMTKPAGEDRLEYRLLSLSVPGHPTIYLENKDNEGIKARANKIMGVQWR
ncbi:Mitochondrial import inner membrane translocase subunit tim21 [Cyphellophora attinorum]|uniref:Mitochondrial import inner membrane translocase subunit Tim21 n=1 Tax=Cyphellophora attinorum TaxID=1664694 RepID=A0A0N1P179_9EURO|nr:Mitochondrial import inner membrane translocase subunit tim21 [Phialophora attinorum]KPI43252.1 Mitochondrial import inner membrane translocase subunit tim21 [Phialophora attinorum]